MYFDLAFQSATSFNRLLCGYEKLLTDPGTLQSELTRTKEKLNSTERSVETMRLASKRNADKMKKTDEYKRQCGEARIAAAESETKTTLMLKRADIAEEKVSRFECEVAAGGRSLKETRLKYEALLKLRDHDLRTTSHSVRKYVRASKNPDLDTETESMEVNFKAVEHQLMNMSLPAIDLEELAQMFEEPPPPLEETIPTPRLES
ncbi:unnamed protein product [Cochlearia groenlandica]